jgi:hypothetical protein
VQHFSCHHFATLLAAYNATIATFPMFMPRSVLFSDFIAWNTYLLKVRTNWLDHLDSSTVE